MANQELRAAGFEVRVGGEARGALHETVVGSCGIGMGSCTGVVEGGKYAGWSAFFDKITDNLVIEVFDGGPFNLFAYIFLLFSLQSELNENLLQFFVDVVDAKLFK